MDKTYNDLMDIVNRTKKYDTPPRRTARPRPIPVIEEEREYEPVEYDVVEKPKRKSKTSSSPFAEGSALGNLINKGSKKSSSSTTKKTTTKKSTTTKKTSSTKTTTTKKAPAKKTTKPADEKVDTVETKTTKKTPVPKAKVTSPAPDVDVNSPLYQALKDSLFSGGTDISEYMTDDTDISSTQANLKELRAKKEAQKINAEISKEQQEYEQLFTGSLGSFHDDNTLEEEDGEELELKKVNVAEKNAKLAGDLNQILTSLENKKNPVSAKEEKRSNASAVELDTGNKDLDRKIAEYYRRKQEKIDKYNAQEAEGLPQEEHKDADNSPVDYDAIFGGPMSTRNEVLGITEEPTEEESVEEAPVEEVVETPVEEVTPETEETPVEEQVEEPVEEEPEVILPQAETDSQSEEIKIFADAEEIQEDVTAEQSPVETKEEKETTEVLESNDESSQEQPSTIEESTEDIQADTEQNSQEQSNKETHIKSILNDLLFSKKEHDKTSTTIEDVQSPEETTSVEDTAEENTDYRKEDYASVWGAPMSEEEADTQEEVEGVGFTMKDSQPEPQEITEYADRSIVEVDDTEETPTQVVEEEPTTEEPTPVEEPAVTPTQEDEEEEEGSYEDFIVIRPNKQDDDDSEDSSAEKIPTTDEDSNSTEDSEEIVTVEDTQAEEEEDYLVISPKTTDDEVDSQEVDETEEPIAENEVSQLSEQTITASNIEQPIVDNTVITEDNDLSTLEPTEEVVDDKTDSNDILPTTDSIENVSEEDSIPVTEDITQSIDNEEVADSEDIVEEDSLVVEEVVETTAEETPIEETTIEEPVEVDNQQSTETTPSSNDNSLFTPDMIASHEYVEPEPEPVVVEEESTQNSNIYDLSSNDTTMDDYIISGNSFDETTTSNSESTDTEESIEAPSNQENSLATEGTEQEDISNTTSEQPSNNYVEDDNAHFESVVNNERVYEQTISQPTTNNIVEDDDDDNTLVMNTLPENRVDLFGNKIEVEGEEEEENIEESSKDDTISKEEFYNEMARLQENLINELKGNKVESESIDFFADKPQVDEELAESIADELIETIAQQQAEEEKEEEVIEEAPVEEEKQEEESIVGINAEPVDPAKFDEYNLLNKDIALNDSDLEPEVEEGEEETKDETPKDTYFYLSPEDNEKKASVVDEYMTVYEEPHTPTKDLGDINFFKNIGNAVPSSEILKEQDSVTTKEVADEEIETIYTLMGIQTRSVPKDEKNISVLYVTSECQPFVASGGLADVAGSLPKAIASQENSNIDIRVIMPLYGTIKAEYKDKFEYLGNFTVHLSWRQEYCGLFRYFKDGVTYYFIDNERYFKRDKLYGYYDDGERYAYFSKAIVEALPHLNFFPDIIHCNDWQSALVSAYVKTGNWSDFRYYRIKHIFTIHNVEYQGVYGMENLKDLFGIDPRFRNEVEYNGDINLCKAAIQYCDKFTTVSNSYCDNLKQPYCSRGLHHIIIRNEYKLSGIINGIDYDFYNPATDTQLFKNYDIGCIEEKVLNKKLWQDEIGLPVDGDTPMIAIVSRLVGHKGLDLITKIIHNTLQQDIQLVVVGTGDEKYTSFFKNLEEKYPTKVRAFVDKYSNEIARKAYGASDIFLMPSKIEPCGLSQMIASRYGSVPIVREVGGLKDTIRDFGCEGGGNGYTFTNYNPNDLQYQLDRAIRDYSNRTEWKEKMKICMSQDFTWNQPAQKYIDLYKSISNN